MSDAMLVAKEHYEQLLHQRNELFEMVHEKTKIIDDLFELSKKQTKTIDEYHDMVVGYRSMVDRQNVVNDSVWAQFVASAAWCGFAERFRGSKNYDRIKLREKAHYLITYDRCVTRDKRVV